MTRRTITYLLVIGALLPACSSPSPDDASVLLKGDAIGKVTQLQLREELKDFADRFAYTIASAANEIRMVSPDPAMCVRAVYWQLFTIPNVQRSAVSPNPVAALVDIWAFCKQLQDFFNRNETFGERTQLARDVSRQLEDDITRIAGEMIPAEYVRRVEKSIDEFVEANPIAGSFARRSLRPTLVKASDAKSLVWVAADLPLAPFRVFMDESAKALREFTLVADSLLTYSRTIPNVFRWQLQLLLYDFETRATTMSLVTNFEATATAIQSLARTADELPKELRREVMTLLDAVDAKQAGLRETLKEVQATLTTADATLTNAKSVMATLEKTTDNWNEAGARWEKAVDSANDLVSMFKHDEDPAEAVVVEAIAREEERGFDIQDYTETAIRAEEAVARFLELTAEARSLLESDSASVLVDKVVWRGVLLIVVFFGSLLLYRVVVARLGKTPPPDSVAAPALTEPHSESEEDRLDRPQL